jgi:hypothetical protein
MDVPEQPADPATAPPQAASGGARAPVGQPAIGRWRDLPPGHDPFALKSGTGDQRAGGLAMKSGGLPAWAIIAIAVIACTVVAGLLFAVAIPALTGSDTAAKDTTVKAGGNQLVLEIGSWPLGDGASRYPDVDEVAKDGAVGAALARDGIGWPENPFTGEPMKPGTGKGDYTYTTTSNGDDYTLTVYLSDGRPYVLKEAGGE